MRRVEIFASLQVHVTTVRRRISIALAPMAQCSCYLTKLWLKNISGLDHCRRRIVCHYYLSQETIWWNGTNACFHCRPHYRLDFLLGASHLESLSLIFSLYKITLQYLSLRDIRLKYL